MSQCDENDSKRDKNDSKRDENDSKRDENDSNPDENDSKSDKNDSKSDKNDSKSDPRDFEKYIDEKLTNCDDKVFLRKLGVFSQALLQHVWKWRRLDTYDYLDRFVEPMDLFALIDGGLVDWNSRVEAVTVGRFILKMAKPIREEMRTVIKNDFPKFLGERANFWRYLLHLISEFSCEGADDFTSRFLLTNVCYMELTSYCYEIDQLSVAQHDKMVWIMMMLHYFGDRLEKEQRDRSVLNFPLIANKTRVVDNVNEEEEKTKEEKTKKSKNKKKKKKKKKK